MPDPIPETTRLFSLLRRLTKGEKLSPDETHELSEIIHIMAGSNIIAEITSFKDIMLSRMDALDSKYTSMRWLIGVGLTLIGIGLTLIGIIVAYGTFIVG